MTNQPSAEAVREWRTDFENCPMFVKVWVAYHGHGENHAQIATRIGQMGHWGDWDYINSHDGEPQFWMPLYSPEPPTHDMSGEHCGCDGCTEDFSEDPSNPATAQVAGEGD